MSRISAVVGLCLMLVLVSLARPDAQGRQTGGLAGTVKQPDGTPITDVLVAATSPALQGVHEARTGANGGYEMLGLPPGDYLIIFEHRAIGNVTQQMTVRVGVTSNASIPVATFRTGVVAMQPSPLITTQGGVNLTTDDTNVLPVGRDLFGIAELAPGLTKNTPNTGQVTINGSFAYDTLFLVDGVDISDNLLATAHTVFIEDAIQEVQVLTSGISAEYGRFSGGVVNAITRSGGNTFSGSFRSNMYKPDWTAQTPFEKAQGSERTGALADNTTYETTVGGPILRDRLWFLFANRIQRENRNDTFDDTGISFASQRNNDRNLIKLTAALTPNHRFVSSYVRNSTKERRPSFDFTIDPAGIVNPRFPNDLFVATYRGGLTSRVFAELQVSQHRLASRDLGGTRTDIVESPFVSLTQGGHYNAPLGDASDPEERNNSQITGSVNYLEPTTATGTHSIKVGFEHFRSRRVGGNSPSATNFLFLTEYAVGPDGSPLLDANGRLIPRFFPGTTLLQTSNTVRGATIDITTLSGYLNDNWTLNDHLSFNLGVRAEAVSSEATGSRFGVDSHAVVPRLAAAYDLLGDGRYVLRSTYGRYSGRYNEVQFGRNTNVGQPDNLVGVYLGPPGQGRSFAPGFETSNYLTVAGEFPTVNVLFDDDLRSPITKEFTLSAGTALTTRGYALVTYVHRTVGDFVEDFVDLGTGSTNVTQDGQNFGTFQNRLFRNTDDLTRDYDAVILQARHLVTDDFVVDGSWTVQLTNDGNFQGEARNTSAISSVAFDWPEITPANRYFPSGRLDGFQRHKARIWGVYTLDLGRRTGTVDIGGMWRYDSARVYSLQANGQLITPTQRQIISELGYASGPDARTLYFSQGRGSERFEGYGLFDLSFQYRIPVWSSVTPWIKAEIFNVFNNDKQIAWNTAVLPDPAGPTDDLGLPTDFVTGPRFGQATSVDHFPQYLPGLDGLRTIRVAVGVRF